MSAGIQTRLQVSFIEQNLSPHDHVDGMASLLLPFASFCWARLYFLVMRMNKFEFDEIPGGQASSTKLTPS
jgi:hypothetical protein